MSKGPTKKLICMMGLPRSGKTTAARHLSRILRAPVVNRDSIRLAMHGQRYQRLAEPMVKAMAIIMVRALFNAGHHTVIVDETNLKESTRDFWRDEAWETSILQVKTPRHVCLARAKAAGDDEIIPVIERMEEEPLRINERQYVLNHEARDNPWLVEVIESIQYSMKGSDLGIMDADEQCGGDAPHGTCSESSK